MASGLFTDIFRVSVILTVNTILNFHVLGTSLKTSCPVSPSTVEVVDDCPDSEEKWRVAAERKNCAAYANQCDEPQRLVYHCTINAFSNQTLEMCAYGKYIFKGIFV
uniref:Uncharacterized protein n=1 Tax=Magallana gigas TaxID=29159 RepID=A0A8W8MHA3_MAGGI